MQCVILAAGRGTRMGALTEDRPKPLVQVAGEPIINHIVSALPSAITELVIVVSYKADLIRKHCGSEFFGRKVTYCEQINPVGGTGDALRTAQSVLQGKFMVLNGDDIHGAKILAEAVDEPAAIIAVYSDTPERFGVLGKNEDGTLRDIVEKPSQPLSNLVNTGAFVTDVRLFDEEVPVSRLGELLVTDMLTVYAKKYPVKIIEQPEWIAIGYPEDVEKAEKILAESSKASVEDINKI